MSYQLKVWKLSKLENKLKENLTTDERTKVEQQLIQLANTALSNLKEEEEKNNHNEIVIDTLKESLSLVSLGRERTF